MHEQNYGVYEARRPADLVNRNFNPPAPNRTWVADFNYVPTWSSMVYLALVFEAYSHGSWAGAPPPTSDRTVLDALEQAISTRCRDCLDDLSGLPATSACEPPRHPRKPVRH